GPGPGGARRVESIVAGEHGADTVRGAIAERVRVALERGLRADQRLVHGRDAGAWPAGGGGWREREIQREPGGAAHADSWTGRVGVVLRSQGGDRALAAALGCPSIAFPDARWVYAARPLVHPAPPGEAERPRPAVGPCIPRPD